MSGHSRPFTVLYVENMEREESFYRDVLGLAMDYSAPGWVQFSANGASIVLHPKTSEQRDPTARANTLHLGFEVEDLESEYNRLRDLRVEFKAPPANAQFGKHATCLDPEGNEIDLLQWKYRPANRVTEDTRVNDIIAKHPETMEVFEDHGIRICGGCLVLLNAPVYETAEYSGLDPRESTALIAELNKKLADLTSGPAAESSGPSGASQ